jgi:hypothetical protein
MIERDRLVNAKGSRRELFDAAQQRHQRARIDVCERAFRVGPQRQREARAMQPLGRRDVTALPLPSAYAAARVCSSPAARDSSAMRAANARRCRAPAPTHRRSARHGSLPAGTGVLRARLRSSVRLRLATATSRSSLPAVSPEIIPPSLMGHHAPHLRGGDTASSHAFRVECTRIVRCRTMRLSATLHEASEWKRLHSDAETLGAAGRSSRTDTNAVGAAEAPRTPYTLQFREHDHLRRRGSSCDGRHDFAFDYWRWRRGKTFEVYRYCGAAVHGH